MIDKIAPGTPNALRHGIFARTLFIFKGDAEEFAEIHRGLCEEWQPEGVSEEDCVHTLATLYFRKKRLPLMLYLQRRKTRNQPVDQILDELLNADPAVDPSADWGLDQKTLAHHLPELDPLVQRVSDLLGLSRSLFSGQTPNWFWETLNFMAPQDSDYIRSRVGKDEFRTNVEFAGFIKKIVDDELLPAARRELRERVGQTEDNAVRAFDDLSCEDTAAELALLDKIEQQIERRLAQLGRIRALKSMGLDRPGRRHNRSRSQIIDNDAHAPPALPPQAMATPVMPTAANGESQVS